MFKDLQLKLQLPIPLHCDNKSAIAIAASPVYHERTKHFDIDFHLIREYVEKGFISTPHVDSKCQLADSFTKAVSCPQLTNTLSKLGIITQFQTRGGMLKSVMNNYFSQLKFVIRKLYPTLRCTIQSCNHQLLYNAVLLYYSKGWPYSRSR